MPKAQSNNIELEYETYGEASSPALLLIAGLGIQLIGWDSKFCQKIAESGYYVIRFDNRDIGFSTKCNGMSLQEITKKIFSIFMGKAEPVPYTIEDMADDAAGLLDFLNIEKAHICGMSMGGFIAQTFAVKYPEKTRTLTSIYSHTGENRAFQPTKEAMEAMLAPAPAEQNGYIDQMTSFFKLTYGDISSFDEKFHRDFSYNAYSRAFYPDGIARQYLAIITQKDRTQELKNIKIPSLIIHGDKDPLVPLSGGIATKASIPCSELKTIKGMGHAVPDFNNKWWKEILDSILIHLRKA